MSEPILETRNRFNVAEDHWGFKAEPGHLDLWFDADERAVLTVMNHIVGGEEVEVTFDTNIAAHIDTSITSPPFIATFNDHVDIEFMSKPGGEFDVYMWVRESGSGNRFRARAGSDPRVRPR